MNAVHEPRAGAAVPRRESCPSIERGRFIPAFGTALRAARTESRSGGVRDILLDINFEVQHGPGN